MIRKNNECSVELRENMRGGDGTVKIGNLVKKEELKLLNDNGSTR